MKRHNHSPAYVLEIKKQWRVVVPISGKLTPRICAEEFPSRSSAEAWLRSDEGKHTIEGYRVRRIAYQNAPEEMTAARPLVAH